MSQEEPQRTVALESEAETQPAAGAPARLVIVAGNDVGRQVLLDRDELRLGRDQGNDLVLASSVVSARHARVFKQGQGFAIEDLGSTNGVQVNGESIPPRVQRPLRHGDAISISDHLLLFLSRRSGADRVDFGTIRIDRDRASREAEELLAEFPGIRRGLGE